MNKMKIAALLILVASSLGSSPRPATTAVRTVDKEFPPDPQMQKLLEAFAGHWKVEERFEISASRQGQRRQGTALFRAGPGVSLSEEYQSTGSAGPLNFLALWWWDPGAQVYRLLTCANNNGCAVRGTARWQGKNFVNSWEENDDGKAATFTDSFVDISPSSFQLISEGSSSGKVIWRVITNYKR